MILLERAAAIVGAGNVLSSSEDVQPFVNDWRKRYRGRPLAVVRPGSTAEVAALVQLCAQTGTSIVPQGGNTSLCGASVPDASGQQLVISLVRMNKVRAVDALNNTLTVEAGCILANVQKAADAVDRLFPLSLGGEGSAVIGGNLSTNAGGTGVLRYGNTRELVLGLEVVLPDGTITTLGGDLPEMPGLDLRGVFIGSEGTLGITTAVTLRLLRAPQSVAVLLADFTAMEAAGEAVRAVTEAGVLPAGMEMMDRLCIEALNDYFGAEEYPADAAAVLLIELDGQESEVAAAVALASDFCRRAGARTIREARDEAERAQLWKGRKSAISALGRRFPSYYLQDGVVPRGALPRVLAAIERLSARHGLPVANVFHAGDGNLHPLILYRADEPGVIERVEALGAEILRLCLEAGGSITGEHGVGIDKRCYMDWMFSPDDLATMQLVRHAFDPANLANPGKLFPTPAGCAESARRRSEIPGGEALEVV